MAGLVSVIIPNYNAEQFIGETLESVLAQTYADLELLVIDDCSTDNSVSVIRSYMQKDSRIRLFQNEENRGAAYTRNVGLFEAKGKWVAFLDSDDLWLPTKLETQIAFMESNHYAFSYTKYGRIDEASRERGEIVGGPKKVNKRKIFHYNYLGCLTVMYDREHIGLLQVDQRIANGRNDYALWLKACRKATCYLCPQVLAEYRLRQSSLSHTSFKKLIKYQYELFRISEGLSVLHAAYRVGVNLVFGTIKKISDTRKTKQTDKK